MIDLLTSPAGKNPVVISAVFPASSERLFDAWTQADDLRRWFGNDPSDLSAIELDLKVGGLWRFHMRTTSNKSECLEGHYIEIRRPRRLRFSWTHVVVTHDDVVKHTPPSQVDVQFEPMGAATRLTLEHKEISTRSGRLGVGTGWHNSLKALSHLLGETV
ncbi:SRPBCC domain-containing protein [Roseobacter sp. YSTF-M11]|uniref:SRPBCC domain-containing protein n=1 Tax=Roseobacter insulae TaxID=2859783 RepID=A0A9X1K1C7_9RHOB|nr:SRPBCC domain-containing protein [Roseobacter insulae]MBW4707353.1 SRPBCC domain-containing protein [Roseobacter insulae]